MSINTIATNYDLTTKEGWDKNRILGILDPEKMRNVAKG